MNDSVATPDEAPDAPRATRWGVIGIVAAVTIVVALVAIVGIRAFLSTPHPTLGVTDAAQLQLGSCVLEDAPDADRYTVVDCSQPHPQQIVADIDLSVSTVDYTHFESTATYAQEVCDRYLEYGLFVPERVADVSVRESFELRVTAMPTEEEFGAGRVTALCAIRAVDGRELTESLYEPLPR